MSSDNSLHPPDAVAICAQETRCAGDLLPAFDRLRTQPFPWLLDSALPGSRLGRYSFAGADPYLIVRAFDRRIELETRRSVRPGLREGVRMLEGDPFECVRRLLPAMPVQLPPAIESLPFIGGAVGYFGYELAQHIDAIEFHSRDDLAFPALTLLFVDRLLALDHEQGRALAIGLGFGGTSAEAEDAAALATQAFAEHLSILAAPSRGETPAPHRGAMKRGPAAFQPPAGDCAHVDPAVRRQVLSTPLPDQLSCSLAPQEYRTRVRDLLMEIEAGNVYEANLTQRMSLPFEGDAWELYLALRSLSPAPFAAYIELAEGSILSSSPERFLRLGVDRWVESRPIKGTRPRGATERQDDVLCQELAQSSKDRAENLMIVDLVRNDLGRVCEIGSVQVPEFLVVEPYASVFHLVSTVTGKLRPEEDGIGLIRAAFPPGSMTGAPKIAAMKLIEGLETVRRGVYSGAIGYLDVRGGLDLSVVIRTLLVKKGHSYLHVGGAVVSDSDPDDEYQETLDKARGLLAAWSSVSQSKPG